MATEATEQQLFRSRDDAFIGGVCAGLADYFEMDAIVIRILAVLLATLTFGLAAIVYVVLWLRLPVAAEGSTPYDVMPESAESTAFGCVDCSRGPEDERMGISMLARLAVAAGLMVLFLAVSMGVSPLMPGTRWWQFWPLCLLMIGLCLIIIPIRSKLEGFWHAFGIVLTSVSASILPMSLGIISWSTIGCAVAGYWPLLLLAAVLLGVGLYQSNDAMLIGSAFCVVAFCVIGAMACVVPGDIEALFFHAPTGQSIRIAIIG